MLTRRKLLLYGLSSFGIVLTGCATSNQNILSSSPNSVNSDILFIEEIKESSLLSSVVKQRGRLTTNDFLSAPAFYGPKLGLTKEEYDLKRFGSDFLLFENFGVRNYLYLLVRQNTVVLDLDAKANKYGFNNLQELFDYLYILVSTRTPKEVLDFINYLDKNDVIDKKRLLSGAELDIKTKQIVSFIFKPYLEYEKNIISDEMLKKWKTKLNGSLIHFKLDDYKEYAFIISVISELMESETKIKIYGM